MPKGYGYGNSRLSKSVGDSGGMNGTNPGGPISGKVVPKPGHIEKGGGGNNIVGTAHVPHPKSSRPNGEVMSGHGKPGNGKPQGFGGRGPI